MGRRRIFERVAKRIRNMAGDARLLGTGILKRELCAVARKRECRLRLAGVGPVTIRLGDTDLASFLGIFRDGEFAVQVPEVEAAVRDRYDATLASGCTPVIVDAGAYVGASALWFRSKFPRAHIVAIEPDPESFRLLEQNVESAAPVTTVQAAAGAKPGKVRLVRTRGSWATQVERSDDGIGMITMNDAFALVPGGKPLLAKVNIEGFEKDLFSAGLEWLDEVSMVFIEPHDWLYPGKHTSRSFQKALGERDFHLFICGPHLCYARL